MKKSKSIFTRLLLLILPLVLIADMIILAIAYALTYQSNLEQNRERVELVSREVAQYFESFDPNIPSEFEHTAWYLDSVCALTDMTYIYCVVPDPTDSSIRFLSIGFGKDAAEEARQSRYPGVVVPDVDDPELFATMNGQLSGNFRVEHNEYGDMLISYTPVTRHYDSVRHDYVDNDIQSVVGVDMSVTEIIRAFRTRYLMIAIYMVVTSVLIVLGVIAIVYRRVRLPAREISRRMSEYVANREKHTHEEKLIIPGDDEFSLMAESFNTMTEDIDRYIDDIEVMNREKHVADAELNIARGIQMGLLQPDRMDGDKVQIRAYMLPARDVGGDLYDYCLLDDGKIFAAIADVSGKGISAALFMSRAITLLHQYATAGYSPARILKEYNNTLAEHNPGGLFITTFLAIYDPATGVLTYSNAGHNIPYILTDALIPLDGAHGVAAGLFPEEEYEDAAISFAEGALFLYTDGVNEARNVDGAFYSTERLEEMLTAAALRKDDDPLQTVLDDLNRFSRGAPQNDDITILSLRIERQPAETVLHLTSELPELTRIRRAIFALDVSEDMKRTLYLGAEEVFVNICSYAYERPGPVELRLTAEDGVKMTFIDSGAPFDPTADVLKIDDYDHEHAVGGLGRFIVFSIADRYHYEYRDGKNVLYLYFDEVTDHDHHENA